MCITLDLQGDAPNFYRVHQLYFPYNLDLRGTGWQGEGCVMLLMHSQLATTLTAGSASAFTLTEGSACAVSLTCVRRIAGFLFF